MFYIFDQGARTQTPIASLLNDDRIQAVQRTSRTAAIGHEQRIGQPPYQPPHHAGNIPYEAGAGSEEEQRHPATRCGEIMTSPVFTLSPEDSVAAAWQAFGTNNYHHIPLLDANRQLAGMVSDRDLLRFAASNPLAGELAARQLSELATRRVITAAQDTSIRYVAEVMMQHRFGSMPIIDEAMQLAGIVTRSDILKAVVNTAPLELWV